MHSLPQSLVDEPFGRCAVKDRSKSLAYGWRLIPFQPRHAPTIARWVQTEQQLRWLAPSTHPPLTVDKVMGWKKPGGESFVLVKGEGSPLAYGEINPMRKGGEYLWLGHVIVRPDQRGQGLGSTLLRALLVEAFERRNATRVALIVFPDNLAALRCYRRAGFILTGEERHQFSNEGPIHRLLRLEIIRPQWLEQNRNSCSTPPDVETGSTAVSPRGLKPAARYTKTEFALTAGAAMPVQGNERTAL